MEQAYLTKVNKKETNPILVSLLAYAKENNVPIIREDGIHFINQIIKLKNCKNILEIGTAIGYSSIKMALENDCHITTIERDPQMIKQATINIERAGLQDRITLIKMDALEVDETKLGSFDLIFIDAAKAQSIKFFEKFTRLLTKKGIVITDNLLFHGLVYGEVRDRNLKQLVRKINTFNEYIVNKEGYDTYIYKIGDGMSLSIRKDDDV